jgi:hypothetical protein
MSKHRPQQRDSSLNQQVAKAIRPQLPQDGSAEMQRWQPGDLPTGGFRSVIDMSGNKFPTTGPLNTKTSSTSGGGKKVY